MPPKRSSPRNIRRSTIGSAWSVPGKEKRKALRIKIIPTKKGEHNSPFLSVLPPPIFPCSNVSPSVMGGEGASEFIKEAWPLSHEVPRRPPCSLNPFSERGVQGCLDLILKKRYYAVRFGKKCSKKYNHLKSLVDLLHVFGKLNRWS